MNNYTEIENDICIAIFVVFIITIIYLKVS